MENSDGGGFEVRKYSIELLLGLIAKKSKNSQAVVAKKLHAQYFEEYFEKLKAATVLIENRYVDRDFLEDFSAYYVRCFSNYDRFCTRFHFFTTEFSEKEFAEFLRDTKNSHISLTALSESYLGFIVIKPLPETFIGRTCLKTYPEENGRYFPSVRTYSAHPFGLDLEIKSLAFQEQDSVVAACATSALWSTFHGTGKRFQHSIPSPVEITRSATKEHPLRTRVFPNRGLEISMMAQAIQDIGLEPYYVQITQSNILKETAYAYLQCQIPVVLIFELWDQSRPQPLTAPTALHAVSVAGFRLDGARISATRGEFSTKAGRMAKLYAHDDQVGPFARMEFDGQAIHIRPHPSDMSIETHETLSTSLRIPGGKIGDMRVMPIALLIPLYHKIRIPYASIHEAVRSFDYFIKLFVRRFSPAQQIDLEWDISLTTGTDHKRQILASDAPHALKKTRSEILSRSFPRFLWKASAYRNENLLLDLIFDATDIESGRFFVCAVEWEVSLGSFLRSISKLDITKLGHFDSTETQAAQKIIEWFRKQEDTETS